jgi:hypothetical protein
MKWKNVKDELPDVGFLECIDVFICCGSNTYSGSYIKHKNETEGRFYFCSNYPKNIFENLTEYVSHWMYVELPNL